MKTVMNAVPETVEKFLADTFLSKLEKNEPVLFLCTGGPTAKIAVSVCEMLLERFGKKTDVLKWLFTVSLADERFGAEGHADSTWKQLVELGLPVKEIGTVPLLRSAETDDTAFAAAVRHYNAFLAEAADKKKNGTLHIAALFGIGVDDQTAGILPDCPVVNTDAQGRHDITSFMYAGGYHSALLTRMTITPAFFPVIDQAIVWIESAENPEAALRLEKDLSPVDHPAQLLKQAKETVVFIRKA